MGNDGGSIPDRRDLVKTKAKAEQVDKANQLRARWFFCALSKRLLQEPIVSCALGKLYNKDAIIEYLLDKAAYGDGEKICGHIRSLKDVRVLKLTPNPAPSSLPDSATNSSTDRAQFICPLTLKEINGNSPFAYIATCGCVMSQAGLKALIGTSSSSGSLSPSSSDENGKDKDKRGMDDNLELCPSCGTKYDRHRDVLQLNPDPETEETMRGMMEVHRATFARGSKGSKKRKAAMSSAVVVSAGSETCKTPLREDEKNEKVAKKVRTSTSTPVPSVNPTVSAASRAVATSLAMEEAKRKASMSEAVKSLYGSRKEVDKETFLTRGTFTRYA